jgi:hypothetical protein
MNNVINVNGNFGCRVCGHVFGAKKPNVWHVERHEGGAFHGFHEWAGTLKRKGLTPIGGNVSERLGECLESLAVRTEDGPGRFEAGFRGRRTHLTTTVWAEGWAVDAIRAMGGITGKKTEEILATLSVAKDCHLERRKFG